MSGARWQPPHVNNNADSNSSQFHVRPPYSVATNAINAFLSAGLSPSPNG